MANYIYARVANANFELSESNIEKQVKKFKHLKTDKIYVDIGLSGRTLNRTGLSIMIKDIKNGDNVYVSNISVLALDTVVLLRLIETIDRLGATLHSDDLPNYKLISYMKKTFYWRRETKWQSKE